MKMSVNERAHKEHLVRLQRYKRKRVWQWVLLGAECLLLVFVVLAYSGVSFMEEALHKISIPSETTSPDPAETPDPDYTEAEPLPPLESEEEPETLPPLTEDPDETRGEDPSEEAPSTEFVNPAPARLPDRSGYETYVLFGVDTRKQKELLKYTMGDVCIIASVNKQSGEVRLVSVYRDFCVEGENSYFYKVTSAYSKYGADEMVAILNRNLDLQISDYVVVGWTALADIVDIMGGLEINMSREEAVQLNRYVDEVSKATGRPLGTAGVEPRAGVQKVNGVCAVCYSRIRYNVGQEEERTRRQRYVIGQLLDKVKTMSIPQMLRVVDSLTENMKTTLAPNEIMSLAYNYTKYNIVMTKSFPETFINTEALGWVKFSKDLVSDVKRLHQMLYEDDNYTPSENVARIGQYHSGRTKGQINYQD